MLHVSLILESLRAHPRLMFWTAALSQAVLWTLLPTLFYSAPPGELAITLAVGHEFQLGSDGGPPLAFWLAEVAYRFGGMGGVYLLSQLCVVATLMGIFALGRAIVGTAQAVLAVLLMVGVGFLSVPTPEFGPAILAMPIWTMILVHFWRAVGEKRSAYWIALAVDMGLLLLTTSLGWIFFPQHRSLALHFRRASAGGALSLLAGACGRYLETRAGPPAAHRLPCRRI